MKAPNRVEALEALARLLIGGIVVSAFAAIGGLFRPTSFAGLFGSPPPVALTTLTRGFPTGLYLLRPLI